MGAVWLGQPGPQRTTGGGGRRGGEGRSFLDSDVRWWGGGEGEGRRVKNRQYVNIEEGEKADHLNIWKDAAEHRNLKKMAKNN